MPAPGEQKIVDLLLRRHSSPWTGPLPLAG
jgi:hypothetical protein